MAASVNMNVEDLYTQGFQLRCEGRYEEAKGVLARVLAIHPDHSDAKWQMGLIQGFQGDFDGSLETLKQVVAKDAGHINARYDLGMTMMMLGFVDEARQEFEEVLKRNPEHKKAHQQLQYCRSFA